jgi:hypothetical protein
VVKTTSAPMRGLARGRCRHVRIVPPIVDEPGVSLVGRRAMEIAHKNQGYTTLGERSDWLATEFDHGEETAGIKMGMTQDHLVAGGAMPSVGAACL